MAPWSGSSTPQNEILDKQIHNIQDGHLVYGLVPLRMWEIGQLLPYQVLFVPSTFAVNPNPTRLPRGNKTDDRTQIQWHILVYMSCNYHDSFYTYFNYQYTPYCTHFLYDTYKHYCPNTFVSESWGRIETSLVDDLWNLQVIVNGRSKDRKLGRGDLELEIIGLVVSLAYSSPTYKVWKAGSEWV